MATDRYAADMTEREAAPAPSVDDGEVPRSWLPALVIGATGALALAWFLVSWAMLDSPVVDAVGETLGGVMLVLVVVSVVGAVRRGRIDDAQR